MISRSISGMHDAMNKELSMPFEKGKNDCLSFCLSALSGLGLIIADFEPYKGIQPKDPIVEFDSFCLRQNWIRIRPQDADTGAFGLVMVNHQFCPAVFVGGQFILRTEGGILTLPYTSCVLCFRTVV